MVSQELLSEWSNSIIEIKVNNDWRVIWDGENVNIHLFPDSVRHSDLFILTAYNPGSVKLSDQENQIRNTTLKAKFDSISIKGYESVGRSKSGGHCEFGYAVYGVGRDLINKLAIEFGQIGYYRFSMGNMIIYAVTDQGVFVAI